MSKHDKTSCCCVDCCAIREEKELEETTNMKMATDALRKIASSKCMVYCEDRKDGLLCNVCIAKKALEAMKR